MLVLSFICFLAFMTFTYCEKKFLFAYSCTTAGTSYPELKLFPWTENTTEGLTPGGIRQLYVLGRELRERLIDKQTVIHETYNPKQVKVRPIMTEKAIESAYALIAGLYPAGTGHIISNHKVRGMAIPPNAYDYISWIEDLQTGALNYTYQSMPLSLTGEEKDVLLNPEDGCNSYRKFLADRSGDWTQKLAEQITTIADYLRVEKKSIKDVKYLSELRELILDGIVEGQYIKDFTTDVSTYNGALAVDHYIANIYLGDENFRKLAASPILQDVSKLFDAVHKKDVDNKFTFDELRHVSLVGIERSALLAIIKQLDMVAEVIKTPMPASILLFELYKEIVGDEVNYAVQFTYDDEVKIFPLIDFLNKVNTTTFTEEEFKRRCESSSGEGTKFNWILIVIIAAAVILAVAIGIFIKIMIGKCKRTETDAEEEERILSEIHNEYDA